MVTCKIQVRGFLFIVRTDSYVNVFIIMLIVSFI